jgi:hypothetical protein
MLRPIRSIQNEFGKGREVLISRVQEDTPDALPHFCSTGLQRGDERDTVSPQSFGQPLDLRCLSAPLYAFKSNEQAFLPIATAPPQAASHHATQLFFAQSL